MPSLVSCLVVESSLPFLILLNSRVDLHPTASDTEEPDEEDDAETYMTPADPASRATATTENARHNRRSRILNTLNVGRMRHATADERIEALRRLRTEVPTQPATENDDQGSSIARERTMNRARARLSRAFGSRPNSTVHTSRPTSQVPAVTTATTSAEGPLHPTEASASVETHAPEASAPLEPTAFAGALASSPR